MGGKVILIIMPLYISLVIIHAEQTGWHTNDSTATQRHAPGGEVAHPTALVLEGPPRAGLVPVGARVCEQQLRATMGVDELPGPETVLEFTLQGS